MKAAVTSLLASGDVAVPQAHELLTIINEECDRLNHLVEEAAEMARLEAGEIELHIAPASIEDIIQGALALSKSPLGAREIQVKVAPDLPPVEADIERAQDILVKLIDNANLYSSREQPIIITAELAGDYVTTSVADRGPGIDDLEQGMIFDKFYRGKDQRYLVRGTGMGLPIAKAIVAAHHGTIGVTSQLGHGSVFSFSLPVARSGERSI
jgi:two-component system sensor histidine kinase KdpD